MTKYRTRLLFGLIMLILVALVGIGLLIGQLFKNTYLDSYDARLNKESTLVATYLQEQGGIANLTMDRIENLSGVLDSRISIIDTDGKVVYDSGDEEHTSYKHHTGIIEDIYHEIVDGKVKDGVVEVESDYNLHYYWSPIVTNGGVDGYLFLSTKLTEIKKVYQQIWWILTISLGLALIIIIIIGYQITARYTKPIESATRVAIELAKGNYRARTYEDHIDETGMLSVSINTLARNLQGMVKAQEIQQDRLGTLIENMGSGLILIDSRGHINLINRTYKEIFNIKQEDFVNKLYYEVIEYKELSDLIEEIFMTEQKVRKQIQLSLGIVRRYFEVYGVPIIGTNDVWKGVLLVFHDITEIKKLEQVRKDFVANVSHELRTPITSIKGFSETLLDGAMEDKQTLEAFLGIILKESDRLQSLIQDLLDLSKIEQQGYTLNIVSINIVQLLDEVMAILNGKATEKDIVLLFENNETEIYVEGDPYRLKQIFINLITNAISYTPNGGKVTITLKDNGNMIQTKVQDTGIGIEEKEIPRIFERFYRIDKARSRNSGGTGLGLAIVKHLVEAHKGHISATSILGKGTTFILELHKKFPENY